MDQFVNEHGGVGRLERRGAAVVRGVPAAAWALAWSLLVMGSIGGSQAGAAPPPGGLGGPPSPPDCPYSEMPCDLLPSHSGDSPEGGPSAPAILCPCGPGAWVQGVASTQIDPPVPFEESKASGLFDIYRNFRATPSSALAHVKGGGTSPCFFGCSTGATSSTGRSSFSFAEAQYWEGLTPACPRAVSLAAMGTATQAVGVSTTASMGCSASASSSVAGSCSSLGNASAQFGHSIIAQAQFNAASSTVKLSGNIGAMVSVESVSVQGSCSKLDAWETSGVGSATGTASFTVKPDRTYCAFTNKAFTKRASGSTVVVGVGSLASGGAVAFEALGHIRMWVQ